MPILLTEQGVRQNIQGGITAIYAADKNYKVEAVWAITPLRKVSSNNKKRQSKQNPSKTFSKLFFSEVLDEACEREEQKTIQIQTSGYTKNAMPFYNIVHMREYSQ